MKLKAHVSTSRRIFFNGVDYHSIDEMPAEARATFEKMVATEVPADLRPLFDEHGAASVDVRSISRRIVFNGVDYHSIDEMPAEARAAFEKMIETQVPADLRPLFDEHGAAPVDVRRLIDESGGTATGPRRLVYERGGDTNATAVRLLLAGLLAAGAIAGYFWLRP